MGGYCSRREPMASPKDVEMLQLQEQANGRLEVNQD